MTKQDIARKEWINEKAKKLEGTGYCGIEGERFELEMRQHKSNKIKTATAGKNDTSVRIKADNKQGFKYVPAEAKTNGGRVGNLFDGTNRAKYVIYNMDITVNLKPCKTHNGFTEHRKLNKIIMTKKYFIATLTRLNAVKPIKNKETGEIVDWAIQVTNKTLYEFLKDYPLQGHTPDTIYEPWEFENIELPSRRAKNERVRRSDDELGIDR